MNRSTKTKDDILEEGISNPRPIDIPNAVAGYFADLIIQFAKNKVEECSLKKNK